ncbi:MAG: pantoate--beta-alanine ligase [Schwartzia succinivorans]|uniref:pantoate--beta-alanine ligase n=1 Tax=Schwartzia succinivorans TaxID=55507 RepID=UPI002357E926|nr:pantoate--beta-alanine ligase [Schwartzia succinivorans]MBE6097404.1 pantoate--beta-alanine ligase [Schwartzia succinivorans]
MKVLRTVKEIQEYTKEVKAQGKTIGLVPTMGCLHEGHLTLMRAAREACDIVIASVFVNPTQFGPNEDFDAYPRQFDEDCKKLETVPVDAVFHPEPEEMYPEGFCTYVNVEGEFTHRLCGAQRPIHFRGVATVVTKLMNLARADKAFFGQKDAQQVVVVKRFVEDLNIPVEITMVPIVREPSGLARSSRNRYLSDKEKEAALILSKSLKEGQKAFDSGEKNARKIEEIVTAKIKTEPMASIDYVKVYSFPALEPIDTVDDEALLAIAVRIGKTRLIDNVILK